MFDQLHIQKEQIQDGLEIPAIPVCKLHQVDCDCTGFDPISNKEAATAPAKKNIQAVGVDFLHFHDFLVL